MLPRGCHQQESAEAADFAHGAHGDPSSIGAEYLAGAASCARQFAGGLLRPAHLGAMVQTIREAGKVPVQRDALYRVVRRYDTVAA